ncbi:AbrB/MazE/SpoVT family DNA-binding domain-containing protein [Xanthomonas citri]|uniref:AbrB/MazE/SpoVT family DNA-binding domain-containing protein n=1 Tax=Xanthomonas citri TaxID=346 RepID=UPI000C088345|nr:AbrB/MazE/SpoVT family DNA-binding domain-containing protein [Xanthomonas citri]
MRVAKWGDGLAIRLPVSLVEALELQEGDEIEVIVDGPRLFKVRKKPGLQSRLEQLHSYRGRLPADFTFYRDEANDRR